MTTQYREADIIAWTKSLEVNDKIGVYQGPELLYKTQVSKIAETGHVVCKTGATFLPNGSACGDMADTRCIRPLEDSVVQIGYTRVLNFADTAGFLVKYSDYANEITLGAKQAKIGIVVATEIRFDATNKGIVFPAIIWEGSAVAEVMHPVEVVPYRAHDLKWIEMCTVKPVSA
jgi:hypothetical protein